MSNNVDRIVAKIKLAKEKADEKLKDFDEMIASLKADSKYSFIEFGKEGDVGGFYSYFRIRYFGEETGFLIRYLSTAGVEVSPPNYFSEENIKKVVDDILLAYYFPNEKIDEMKGLTEMKNKESLKFFLVERILTANK